MNNDRAPVRFADLGLSAPALATVANAGYDRPTPVQIQAIPPALAGRDVVACASTGTGKTAAFVLPIVERLAGGRGTRALVLAPTRELVAQIAECFRDFGAARGVTGVLVVGGVGIGPQIEGLRQRRDVIVATPGRLVDHIAQGNVNFDALEVLVLDEADRMLDMGFKAQLDRILKVLPRRRQTMLCSATMGDEVRAYSAAWLKDPVRVEVAKSGTVAAKATQRVFHLPESSKTGLLLALLAQNDASTLVFTRTKHRANRVTQHLDRAGFSVGRIHGNRSQSQRTAALDGFRQGKFRVLVATDVAARGIDVEDIAHVVNFDLSLVADDHVHRVGRTARAEASGLASSFCSPEEVHLLRQIERVTRREIPRAELPAGVPAHAAPPSNAPSNAPSRQRSPARGSSRRPAAPPRVGPDRAVSERRPPRGLRSTGGPSRGRRGRSNSR